MSSPTTPSGPKPRAPKSLKGEDGRVYFRLNELADKLGLEKHVLSYWEKQFPQIVPIRFKEKRNLYTVEHLEIFAEIKRLLYDELFTIAGARKKLRSSAAFKFSSTQSPAQPSEEQGSPSSPTSPPTSPFAEAQAMDPEGSRASQAPMRPRPSLFGDLSSKSDDPSSADLTEPSQSPKNNEHERFIEQKVQIEPAAPRASEASLEGLLEEVKSDLRNLKEMLSRPVEIKGSQEARPKNPTAKKGLH